VGYLRSLASLAAWEGDLGRAIGHLEESLALAEAIDLPGEQWQILTRLGELYRANEQAKKAEQARTRAREIIQALAAGMGDAALRAAFLKRALPGGP